MINNKYGISLIVLVITIIVIIILAASIILTLNNNNPINEANDARYASDLDNMQAILTNTISKIMVEKQAIVIIPKVQEIGEDATIKYKVEDSVDGSVGGDIIFSKSVNSGNIYYTGAELPDYSSKTTKWVVDTDARLYLQIGSEDNAKIYPNGIETLPTITN